MTKGQHNRRNFLSSLALLSVGTVVGGSVSRLGVPVVVDDLEQKWKSFYSKAGGRVTGATDGLHNEANPSMAPGHQCRQGSAIFFEKEQMFAQPSWVYWGTDQQSPSDVIITLVDGNAGQRKITRLNRFELEALYALSKQYTGDDLLTAVFNSRQSAVAKKPFVLNRTVIYAHKQVQQVSYYKEQSLVFHKKFIHQS